ncbi:MAG: YihY/virulence factor BrkB family protein [Nitrospirae bacterium]|nr:YihY/virulence factor BrkB family protein [Nitrospirota bacterium]
MRYLKIIFRSIRDFLKEDGVVLSSYLSFVSIVTALPFCLLIITAFGYLIKEHQAFQGFFLEKLIGFFPQAVVGITEELKRLITFRGIGKWSIMVYFFFSYQFFIALQRAVNAMFKVKKQLSFFRSIFFSLVVVTIVITVLLLSFVLTSFIPLISVFTEEMPFKAGWISAYLIRFVVPFLLMLTIAVSLYVILPMKKVKLRHAFVGGLFTAVMLESAKHIFTWYVGSVSRLGAIYGSLTVFVVFLLWVFYCSSLFLIGASLVNNLEGDKK